MYRLPNDWGDQLILLWSHVEGDIKGDFFKGLGRHNTPLLTLVILQ